MGSTSSRNAVASSSSSSRAEATETRRSVGRRRFRAGCLCPSSSSPDNSLNSSSHEEACGWPIAGGSMHEFGGEADPDKCLSGKLKCIPDLSINCNQRSKRRLSLSRSASHASTSSVQIYNTQAQEPSNLESSSSRGGSNSVNNLCSNDSSGGKHHSNIRLNRATSLGSSETYSLLARRLNYQRSSIDESTGVYDGHLINGTEQHRMQNDMPHNFLERRSRHQSVSAMQPRYQEHADHPSDILEWGGVFSESSIAETGNRVLPQDMAFNINHSAESGQDAYSVIHHANTSQSRDSRRIHRRGTPEHFESNANFRRTRSVGRLRDRVLRRTTSSQSSFSIPEEHSVDGETRRHNRRRFWEMLTRASTNRHAGVSPPVAPDQVLHSLRSMSASRRMWEERIQMNESTSSHNNSTLENRRLYLEERRRRARSQVRALQRLSSSFENLAGHERSCILGGQHRTAQCSCPNAGRTDDSNARASISRIIMLAEALFEVLDEIHHQSISFSSQSSISSLGSFPAPNDIVESMPVHLYRKKEKNINEDAAQCYICLVEYEEGEHLRVLPCHHEFHQLCVDKWLKEVHRVCPLCRGNVCEININLIFFFSHSCSFCCPPALAKIKMGRAPCCDNAGDRNKGAWTKEEDDKLIRYIQTHGEGCWRSLPKAAGLLRCGKSCRLRWINYLRPDLKRGNFSEDEEDLIFKLHALLGNKWSLIAGRLPGRTDNEIKNYWNSHLKRKLVSRGVDPLNHRPLHMKTADIRRPSTQAGDMARPQSGEEGKKCSCETTADESRWEQHEVTSEQELVPNLNLELSITCPPFTNETNAPLPQSKQDSHAHEDGPNTVACCGEMPRTMLLLR